MKRFNKDEWIGFIFFYRMGTLFTSLANKRNDCKFYTSKENPADVGNPDCSSHFGILPKY